jgi:hypothetical protein
VAVPVQLVPMDPERPEAMAVTGFPRIFAPELRLRAAAAVVDAAAVRAELADQAAVVLVLLPEALALAERLIPAAAAAARRVDLTAEPAARVSSASSSKALNWRIYA